jgi:hypothetical protein
VRTSTSLTVEQSHKLTKKKNSKYGSQSLHLFVPQV